MVTLSGMHKIAICGVLYLLQLYILYTRVEFKYTLNMFHWDELIYQFWTT